MQADPERARGWRVISYEAIGQSTLLRLDSPDSSDRAMSLRLIHARAVAVDDANVFISVVEEIGEPVAQPLAREPLWTPDEVAA